MQKEEKSKKECEMKVEKATGKEVDREERGGRLGEISQSRYEVPEA